MTISGFSAWSVSVTSLSLRAEVRTPLGGATTGTPTTAAPPDDRVTAPQDAPSTQPPATSPAAPSRATALFQRLDRDGDGTLSKGEFVSGAIDLLRSARARRQRDEDEGGEVRERGDDHRGRGIGRTLSRAFGRLDADGSGRIDEAELASALEGGDEDAAPPAQAVSVSLTVVNVTYVSVAMQRYASVQGGTSSPTTPTSEATNTPTPPTAAPVAA